MKFKYLTLEEIAKILDGDSEKGCGVNGLCDDHCPLWCDEHGTVCSDLAELIENLKKYFDNDICYNRVAPEAKIREKMRSWTKELKKQGYSNVQIAYMLGLINEENVNALSNSKKDTGYYYVISRKVFTGYNTSISQVIAIVENEKVAKHYCSIYPDLNYEAIKYE